MKYNALAALLSTEDRNEHGIAHVHAIFALADCNGAADARVTMTKHSAIAVVEDTLQGAVEERRRLLFACLVMLISFPARAVYDMMCAYGRVRPPYNHEYGPGGSCQSNQFLIEVWLFYTPEFRSIVVAFSSPLALIMYISLMMSPWERRYLRHGADQVKSPQQKHAARARFGHRLSETAERSPIGTGI